MKYVCTFLQNFPLSHTSPTEKEEKKMNEKCPPPPYIKETSKEELMTISCQRKRVKIARICTWQENRISQHAFLQALKLPFSEMLPFTLRQKRTAAILLGNSEAMMAMSAASCSYISCLGRPYLNTTLESEAAMIKVNTIN